MLYIQYCNGLAIVDDVILLSPETYNPASTLVPVEFFFAAGILFYVIALGKEGSVGWWCFICDLI